MGNHTVDCPYCGEDMRGLSGVSGCRNQAQAERCYHYTDKFPPPPDVESKQVRDPEDVPSLHKVVADHFFSLSDPGLAEPTLKMATTPPPSVERNKSTIEIDLEWLRKRIREEMSQTDLSDDAPSPNYYEDGRRHKPIDVIEDWALDFHLGSVVQYVSRAGRKEGATALSDLKKARWYLDRAIARLEASQEQETPPKKGWKDY